MRSFFLLVLLVLVLLFVAPAPVYAQSTQTQWFFEYRYKTEACEPESFSMVQTEWALAFTIFTDKTPTFEAFNSYNIPFFPCEGQTQTSSPQYFHVERTAYIYLGGEYYNEYFVYGWDAEFRFRKGEEKPSPIGEFSCDVVIPQPLPPYNPTADIERIKAAKSPAQLDLNLIGDYEIVTRPVLPLQVGSYRRDINLGGLVNLKYFFYAIILWRTLF